jgi:PAS domain S-box-containing protein
MVEMEQAGAPPDPSPASADPPRPAAGAPRLRLGPLGIALIYALAGGAWIVLSDRAVSWVWPESDNWALAQTIKGLIYIGVTTGLVYWLSRTAVRHAVQGALSAAHHRAAQRRLQTTKSLLDNVLANLGEAVVVVAPEDRRIVQCNPAAEQMFGYSKEELLGQSTEILHVSREAFEEFARRGEAVLQRGEVFTCSYQTKKKDGSIMETEHTVTRMHPELAWQQGVISVIRDVTEHRKLEAQLRQAQKMEAVGQLAGGVAHDFNNLLTIILGSAQMASWNVQAAGGATEDLQEIERAAEQGAELTRQLLAFARKQTIAPVALRLDNAIESRLKMLRRLIGEEIDLQYRREGEDLQVELDPGQLDQILMNLVVNARDAIDGTGTIALQARRDEVRQARSDAGETVPPGDYVALEVIDDGEGMDESTQQRIFDPFFTTRALGRGTGLGLATVHGIVKQNGGFIEVLSAPGQGATMRVLLPRLAGEAEPPNPQQPPAARPAGEGERTVLLVEDQPHLLALGQRQLTRLGYRVLAAASPGEALALGREHAGAIHLLITDVVMPEMNGPTLYRELLATRPGLPCLYVSGYSDEIVSHRGVVLEDVELLHKPYTLEDLSVRVRRALGARGGTKTP